MPSLEATVEPQHSGVRLDKYIADVLGLFSRSQIPHRQVTVQVNGAEAKLSTRLGAGDRLHISYEDPEPTAIEAEDIPLDILYEDADVVVINKPTGMVVHPAAGHWSGTVVQALLHHVRGLSEQFSDGVRPGIVHRLDRDTSGVLVAGKHPAAVESLAKQFKARTTRKTYLAMVKGQLASTSGVIETNLGRDAHHRKRFAVVSEGGKEAVTEYRLLHQGSSYAFVQLEPKTGRTHQLRVHMAHLGHPVVGDPIYSRQSNQFPELPLMLHAYRLEINLPDGTRHVFVAPLPERILRVAPADLAVR
jgi:23S rRNA pseudouridine1911/1915/1917 synthase